MSLNYDLRDVAEGVLDSMPNGVTEALIWATIPVGISRITDDNAPEFFDRCEMLADVYGAPLVADGKDRRLTFEEVKAHVGLKTNASPKTPAQFGKDILRTMRANAERARA